LNYTTEEEKNRSIEVATGGKIEKRKMKKGEMSKKRKQEEKQAKRIWRVNGQNMCNMGINRGKKSLRES
jgi:hypothetical protein